MTANRLLIDDVRARLSAEADAERAAGQQRYMKSALSYFGVTMPRIVAITKEVFRTHPLVGHDDWCDTILAMFRGATHRELWYAAVHLAEHPAYRAHARRPESLGLYEILITEAAWWDVVDTVASHLVGGLFEADAAWTADRMREWSTDADLWKRRTAIICQLGRRQDLDLPLLYDCIAPSVQDHDFFIRKAIGWALREASKTHPQEVIRYVEEHRADLSSLSKREALKRLLKADVVDQVP